MIVRSRADTYRKIFLFTAIPFGLYMGLLCGLSAGPWRGLVAGIGSGLFYGLFMSLTLGAIHQFSTRQLKPDHSETLLGVHQVEVVTIQQPIDETFATCQATLKELKNCRIIEQDKEFGVLRAQTGMTWKSFGEKVMVTVSSAGPNLCKVTISSKPAVATTLIDYGKNVENVRSILDSLHKRATFVDPKIESTSANVAKLSSVDDPTDGTIQILKNDEASA